MEPVITDEVLLEQIRKNSKRAERILEDEDRLEEFLQRLEKKLKEFPLVGDKLANVPVLISMVRSYSRKEYRDIPLGTILAVVSGLIYWLSPIDLIPDLIPGIGLIDDAAMLVFILKMIDEDVKDYREWQVQHGKR